MITDYLDNLAEQQADITDARRPRGFQRRACCLPAEEQRLSVSEGPLKGQQQSEPVGEGIDDERYRVLLLA
jgi:hypothetical protein